MKIYLAKLVVRFLFLLILMMSWYIPDSFLLVYSLFVLLGASLLLENLVILRHLPILFFLSVVIYLSVWLVESTFNPHSDALSLACYTALRWTTPLLWAPYILYGQFVDDLLFVCCRWNKNREVTTSINLISSISIPLFWGWQELIRQRAREDFMKQGNAKQKRNYITWLTNILLDYIIGITSRFYSLKNVMHHKGLNRNA